MMYREPSDSPWGLVVRCDTLCPGVYSVSTAGHGGIMAQIDAARQLLSPEAQAVFRREVLATDLYTLAFPGDPAPGGAEWREGPRVL